MKANRTGLLVFRWVWTAFVVFATSAPYLANFLFRPAHYHYTWILPPYPEDAFAYMAWSQQAAHGHWLFQLKYTALPHSPFLFHPFFLICGWLSWLLPYKIGIIFWVVKGIGTALFLLIFFKYSDYLGLTKVQSVISSVLVGITSGFGGLLVGFGLADRTGNFFGRPFDTGGKYLLVITMEPAISVFTDADSAGYLLARPRNAGRAKGILMVQWTGDRCSGVDPSLLVATAVFLCCTRHTGTKKSRGNRVSMPIFGGCASIRGVRRRSHKASAAGCAA